MTTKQTILNEHFQPLNEDMRFEALSQLRELQSNLVGISFLAVISIMKKENPLKKEVLQFQDDLDELTMNIQAFISMAKNDVDFKSKEDEEAEAAKETPEEKPEEDEEDEPEETPEEEPEEKDKKPKKAEVEDSSEPKDK